MEKRSTLICSKCNVPMEPMTASFSYLGRTFRHKVLRCPKCGQVYLPEDLVKGKVAQVEKALEDK